MAATGNNIAKSNDNTIQKVNLYKDSVIKSMDKVTDFDKSVINANGEYIKNLAQADKEEYEVLKENMVIAVEPGIYIPRSFGIRIEDTVVITKNGCIKLTKSEKNYTIIAWLLCKIVVQY